MRMVGSWPFGDGFGILDEEKGEETSHHCEIGGMSMPARLGDCQNLDSVGEQQQQGGADQCSGTEGDDPGTPSIEAESHQSPDQGNQPSQYCEHRSSHEALIPG